MMTLGGGVLLVLLILWLFAGPSEHSGSTSKGPSPEQRQAASRAGLAAARRAAVDDLLGRGEITPDDRDAMLEVLFSSRPTRGPGAPPSRR
jgi:hypothetical protein